jgi:phage tail-like protein
MEQPSSYLQYLPQVLQQETPDGSGVPLGSVLKIFEKLLTGIPDGVELLHEVRDEGLGDDAPRVHEHAAFSTEVARLHRLFDPWTTPEEFLPWLASWVALEFPTLQDRPLWDEYQRRRVTSRIARIYRTRGGKTGLNTYLELFAVGGARPRVVLDDGTRLLTVSPYRDAPAGVAGLVLQGPVVIGNGVRAEGVTRPWSVAVASDGSLLVADIGLPVGASVQIKNRVWRLSPSGAPDLAGAPPRPRPVAPDSLPLTRVVAVAVRPARGATPETLYVLDRPGRLFAVPAPFPTATATQIAALATPGATLAPVAMTVDGNGDLLVLDRGDGPGTPNPPGIITVRTDPVSFSRTRLQQVVEPLSLGLGPDGSLLVGDGGIQDPSGADPVSGNLVRVDRNATPWAEAALLPADNPLVAPTGIATTPAGGLYVLDAGLKPFTPSVTNPFIGVVAEHAAVLAVDPDATPPTAVRITPHGRFVYPTGMAAAGDHLVVCDPGQPEVAGLQPYWSRIRSFQFDVVVHFAAGRLPSDPAERRRLLDQSVGSILAVIDEQKPAHTLRNLITAI